MIKHKIVFRFVVLFFILLIIPFPLNIIPGFDFIDIFFNDIYHFIIPWIGKNILQLKEDITVFTNGSGDTTYDYVLVLFFILVAIIGAVFWTFFFRSKEDLIKINYWFRVGLRYYLGYNMMSYGWAKAIPLQFSEPSFYRLLEPIGDMSPMGLAWTFMGFSAGYTIFSGIAELIGGILLLYKRTQYLGGLILMIVMGNVMALNYFYDIPVKLFSTELWLMALIISTPKIKQLYRLLILNVPTHATTSYRPPFHKSIHKKILLISKGMIVLFIFFYPLKENMDYLKEYGRYSYKKTPLYGLYEITNFKVNQKEIPPLTTDTIRWKYIAIEYKKSMQFYRMDMKRFRYKSEVDTINQKIIWTDTKDSTKVYNFIYTRTDSTMRFQGIHKNDTIDCQTKRLDKKDFRLMNRGFNWIQEYPFNR
ncbi:hypothetical protein [Aquimarina aggregata]|uniref:hypothetical protein n=1 Tax=Aquimarina aggregata TaxID=1642818 RepID=UPI0024901062|nr:hypothetical protein [Aquimarina aggregata]